MSKSALIWGASGVSGWAFVNELLHDYPQPGFWKKIHALTNRPLSLEQSQWPKDDRLNIVSGVDLLEGSQEELEKIIKEKVKGVEEVSHVYYLAYKAGTDVQREVEEAMAMFRRSVVAVDRLSGKLEFVVVQTGSKMYGSYLLENRPTDYIHAPFSESMPRIKPPYHDTLFHHPQLDFITSYAASKPWNWCETRPDIIVGFVPNQNFFSLGTSIAIFLALFKAVEGEGAECAFAGTEKSWTCLNNDSSADMVARQSIHLSLTLPMERKGEAFNVADAKAPSSMSKKWLILCEYFGLKGIPPSQKSVEVRKYIKEHIGVWERLENGFGLRSGHADSSRSVAGFEYFFLTLLDFDRHFDMAKMYNTGFTEERDTRQAWYGVFDRMRKAKILPPE